MRLDVILRVISKLFIPFILLFAIYVLFHGHYSPGGGFQAGAIAAAAVILYAIIFGIDECKRVVPMASVELMISFGVLIFAGIGAWSFVEGYNYLDYTPLLEDPVEAQYWGILAVEAGVMITVTGALVAIFYAFATRGRP